MEVFTVKTSSLQFRNRLIPSFYYQAIKKAERMGGAREETIESFALVSDGEHAHIPRNNKGGIRYLYGRDIKEQTINLDLISDDSFIDIDAYHNDSRCHVKDGDLLMAILGTIGKSVVYRNVYNGVLGIPRHIARITMRNDIDYINQYFLACYFRNKKIRKEVISLSTGNIQKLFSLKNIKSLLVKIPDKALLNEITINEQRALELQHEFDKRIEEAKALLYNNLDFDIRSIADEKIFSISYSSVKSNDFNLSLNRYRKLFEKSIDEIKKQKHIVLGDYFEYSTGIEVGSKAYIDYFDCDRTDTPFIRTSDIINYYPDYYTDFFVKHDDKPKKYSLSKGDVLYSKDGKIGCVSFIWNNTNFIFSSGFAKFSLIDGDCPITPEYLFVALSLPEIGLYQGEKGTVVASTIPHLRKENIDCFVIPVVGKAVIDKITTLVDEAFEMREEKIKLLIENDIKMESFVG